MIKISVLFGWALFILSSISLLGSLLLFSFSGYSLYIFFAKNDNNALELFTYLIGLAIFALICGFPALVSLGVLEWA